MSINRSNEHFSNLDKSIEMKQFLWSKIYTSLEYVNSLVRFLYDSFGTKNIDSIDVDFNNMEIVIKTIEDVYSCVEINGMMAIALRNYMKYLQNEKDVDIPFDIDVRSTSTLFNVILNDNNCIVIKL